MTSPLIQRFARDIINHHDAGEITLTYLEKTLAAFADEIRKEPA